jgi:hypothetical protein
MPKGSGLSQELFIGGNDTTGDVGTINNSASPRTTVPVTGINSTSVERVMTRADGLLEFGHYFNDASEQIHAALKGLPRTDVLLMWLTGNSRGAPVQMFSAKQVNYDWTKGSDGSMTGVTRVETNCVPPEWGEILSSVPAGIDGAYGAGSTSAVTDGGAATSAGAMAQLQLHNITGGANSVVLVQDSADGCSFSTIITFSTVSTGAEPAAERKEVSGTIRRYLRILQNTGTTVSLSVGLRRGTAQDDTAY